MVQEGVIKFNLQFREAPPVSSELLREINAWRKILFLLKLIGQDPYRYGGFGFGNISRRMDFYPEGPDHRKFLISGTQTGGLTELSSENYSTVLECLPEENLIRAEGPVRPSSEALTHGMIYRAMKDAGFVMHVHSPDIWRLRRKIGIPLTSSGADYGSRELAREIVSLLTIPEVRSNGVIAMEGHEDGILSFGQTAEYAGGRLLNLLALAFCESG